MSLEHEPLAGAYVADLEAEGDCCDGIYEDVTAPITRGGSRPAYGPVLPKLIPAWVQQQCSNGTIPADRMEVIAPRLGVSGRLIPEAAAAYRLLVAEAGQAGFELDVSGAYRTFERQVEMLKERYTNVDNGTKPKVFEGKNWYLPKGGVDVSTPGNSNHGWGTAVDLQLPGGRKCTDDPNLMKWLLASATKHGWSWETWEPWHLRLVALVDGASSSDAAPDNSADIASPPPVPPAPTAIPIPELTIGMVSDEVRKLQEICIANGWGDMTKADGRFGERTKAAVVAMQTALGRNPDGKFGKNTAASLAARLGLPAPV